jgi:hypothetical protein
MNIVALIVVVITAAASLGLAVWTWHAMAGMGDELLDLVGLPSIHLEED